ncbi:MAG: J domain-containing protein [Sediminibacterium sp.]|nr:J domain-containing protein [Sediminibacterium sp.]
MRKENHYEILGIPYHATTAEIKRAYRKKALLHHPDKNRAATGSTEKFQAIQTAYSILSNATSKRLYDKTIIADPINRSVKTFSSANEIIQEAKNLNKLLAQQNQFFIDRDWLLNECFSLISEENIQLINLDETYKKILLEEQIKSFFYLPYKEIKEILARWVTIVHSDKELSVLLQQFVTKKQRASLWENNQLIIAAIVGILITLLIMNN